ncbi:MAG: ParA family protein [Angelakisella sp.]
MAKIIAVANQKGGVGKTTTAVNLTAALGDRGKKVLMVDLDPQGNATSGFGITKKDVRVSAYDVLISGTSAADATTKTEFKNVWIIPSSISLAGAEIELVEMENRAMSLRASLLKEKDKYSYIIIDCPPSLGLITVNALAASDTILIPIQPEYYALEGLSQLMSTVRTVKRLYNGDLDIEGVLLTMYDSRLNLTMQVVDEVKKFFAGKIFKTIIPRNVRLSEAPSFGQPIIYYDKASRGTEAYMSLADEILKKNR